MRSPTYNLASFSVVTPEERTILWALIAANASFPAANVICLRGRA